MATKKYYWLKLKNDFFTNKKIKKLRKIAGGDTYTIIYLKMQLLSIKDGGKLFFENVEDSFTEELALELDEDVENVKVTLIFLIKNGLLVEANPEEFILPETIECIGSETSSAERVRKHRELQKRKQLMLHCNTSVTKSNIEIDKDIDIDKDKEVKKKYFNNDNLNSIFEEFIEVRKKLKAVNSERAINTLVNKLNKYDDAIKYQMIENSIVNSWKDVYELKNQKKIINSNHREESLPNWFNKTNEELKAEEMPLTLEEQEEIEALKRELKETFDDN